MRKKAKAATVRKRRVDDVKKRSDELLITKLENESLKQRIRELEQSITEIIAFRTIIDTKISDPAPRDEKKRIEYVERVALLHTDILRQKLLHMIHTAHVLLEKSDNVPMQDQALKGTIYAFRELVLWGDAMVSEYNSYKNSPEKGALEK